MSSIKKADDLVYVVPPAIQEQMARRVYMLPRSLVKAIHGYGYRHGHPSEVAAVRELIEIALTAVAEGFEPQRDINRGEDA